MQDLTPVGLSEDGTRLVLADSSGEEYAVPVDARLRAALRGEKARDGQVEKMKMDSALRPRDIQARIRAGESAEDVATAAQTTVESIMPFAGPVLAERAHVAQNAQKASLRRRTNESSAPRTLGEAAELYFAGHALHDEDVEWDAWRRPDGRWVLTAQYAVSGRPRTAEFTHDLPGRYVVAENDDARILTGELRSPGEPEAVRPQARRLNAVPANQDELPLGDDALAMVRDRSESEAAPEPDPIADTADADWLAAVPQPQESTQESAQEPTEERAEEPAEDQEPLPASTSEDVPLIDEPAAPAPAADEEDTVEVKRSSRRKGRSSVPSWDEIMFGGGSSED